MYTQHLKKVWTTLLLCPLSLQAAFQQPSALNPLQKKEQQQAPFHILLVKEEAKERVMLTKEEAKASMLIAKEGGEKALNFLKATQNLDLSKIHMGAGITLLDIACATPKKKEIAKYLAKHPKLNLTPRYYFTAQETYTIYYPLLQPCLCGHEDIFTLLLSHKNFKPEIYAHLKLQKEGDWRSNPIFVAFWHGHPNIAKKALHPTFFFNVHTLTPNGEQPWDKKLICQYYQGKDKEAKIAALEAIHAQSIQDREDLAQFMAKKYVPLLLLTIPLGIYKLLGTFI